MQFWKAPGNDEVLMLFKSPKPLKTTEIFTSADLQGRRRSKPKSRSRSAATNRRSFSKRKEPSKGGHDSNIEMVMTNAGGATYMAMYVYPLGAQTNADAETALRELCAKYDRRNSPTAALRASRSPGRRTNARVRPCGACSGGRRLTAIGLGTMLGGIFPTIGAGAHAAGPGVILAYVLSGLVSVCVALCYAEFASMVPVAGSAYTYAYATLGELVAWIIGWDLILEYGLSLAPTASSLSDYFQHLLANVGIVFPDVGADRQRRRCPSADRFVRGASSRSGSRRW